MSDTKLCIDCKHYRFDPAKRWRRPMLCFIREIPGFTWWPGANQCHGPQRASPTTGDVWPGECLDERATTRPGTRMGYGPACGPEAKYWEAR